MDGLLPLISRLESLLDRVEQMLPATNWDTDWSASAWRWRRHNGLGHLQAVAHLHHVKLSDLQGVEAQKIIIDRNTRQFLQKLPANNVLLTGARGTGKSSLIKALLGEYAESGLRLIEVEKSDLVDLPEIAEQLENRPERFILFCDDLSFEAGDPAYKALKVALDGSIAGAGDNMLIYATSNRRHLMPEFMAENMESDEIRPGDAVEEKVSLSERFGLWLSFYAFDQEAYLSIVRHWLRTFGIARMTPQVRRAALQWALGRGSRSGRVAWQFARDWAGQRGLGA